MTGALALPLAIVCAFSQPLCDASERVAVRQAAVPWHGLGSYQAGASYQVSNRTVLLTDQVQHPAVLATLLAHELTHVVDPNVAGDCLTAERLAYQAESAEAEWFAVTFGPPQDLTTLETAVLGQMGMVAHLPGTLDVLAAASCAGR